MFHLPADSVPASKTEQYVRIHEALRALLEGERDFLANAANCAALLWYLLPDLNWAGFYFLRGDDLVLGPFQGKPACTRIGPGRGVCGTAVQQRRTLVVANVNDFPGHIACDSASASEVVVPILNGEIMIGVLDLDSPVVWRFDAVDAAGLERAIEILLTMSEVNV